MSAEARPRAAMTEGRWSVLRPPPDRPDRYGLTLVIDEKGRPVADCANREMPIEEQRANARAVAALPVLVAVLHACEEWVGDLKSRPDGAEAVYTRIAAALRRLHAPPAASGDK